MHINKGVSMEEKTEIGSKK